MIIYKTKDYLSFSGCYVCRVSCCSMTTAASNNSEPEPRNVVHFELNFTFYSEYLNLSSYST